MYYCPLLPHFTERKQRRTPTIHYRQASIRLQPMTDHPGSRYTIKSERTLSSAEGDILATGAETTR